MPAKDAATHKQATHLGGPLKAGENMYKNVQESYLKNRFSIVNGEMLYEAIDQYQAMSSSSTDLVDYPAPYSEHTTSDPLMQKQPLLSTDDIYDDVIDNQVPTPYSEHTTNKTSIKKAPLPPLPSVVSDDIYEDTATIGAHYSKHTPNKPPIPLNKRPPPNPPSVDDIYDDIANTVASNTPRVQNKPPISTTKRPPPTPPCGDNEELYDDIESTLDKFTQATSYEVPEAIHKDSFKPPVPNGARPPLLYEDPTDMDYEEI